MTPRIAPGARADVGLLGWAISAVSGRVSGTTGPPNLFLTLGRHRPLFRGWLRFAGRLMPAGKLPRRETELVIIRVALLRDWTDRERAILATVDALHERRDLSDAEWEELRRHLDEREAIELLLLVGHYGMLATTITALRIEPDERRG